MIQKLRYILLILAAVIGGESWAQSGYAFHEVRDVTFTKSEKELSNIVDNLMTISNTKTTDDYDFTFDFTFGQSDIEYQNSAGLHLTIKGKETNVFRWNVPAFCEIKVSYFKANVTSSLGGKMEFKSSDGVVNTQSVGWTSKNAELSGLNLDRNGTITLTTNNNSYNYYIHNLTFTYSFTYYTLNTSELETAINDATNALNTITDATMINYLQSANTESQTFLEACAFPNSYWNGSSVGKNPSEVEARANKLNAITNYLLARTAANEYLESDVPKAVYDRLHPYDDLNPNDYSTQDINGATNEIKAAITLAANTAEAYKSVKSAIATAAARTDHNDAAALEADVTKATNELEAATTVDAINAALANIKNFDNITFNGPFSVDEGATIDNPANAASGNIVAYSSSDPTVMSVDGTTLRALKPGTVTITAITNTGNGYYAYRASETYIINATAFALDSDEGNLPTVGVEYPTITLNRSLSGICTLALPFDTHISDFSDSPDAYAAQLALVTYNKADGYTLYFMKVDGGHMSANEPYVICLPSTKDSFVWADVTIDSVDPLEKVEGENESFQGWTMQANYTPGVSMEGKYGIVGGKLCLGGAGSTINAYTAYFIPPAEAKGRVRVAMLDNDGTTTYIHSLSDTESDKETTAIYRLDGTRQTALTKGINIVRMQDGSVRKVLK